MIEILDQSTNSCLAVHFSGKITGEEYRQFLSAVDERLKDGEKIGLVLVLTGFEFYDDLSTARKESKQPATGQARDSLRYLVYQDKEI
jgi:anti-anti-sigma regulatory factor